MCVQKIGHHVERARPNHGVAVKKQKVFTPCLPNALVVGFGEAEILGILNQHRLAELRADSLGAAIGRVIVDDDDLGRCAGMALQGFQTIRQ